jgi:hypothetical protein
VLTEIMEALVQEKNLKINELRKEAFRLYSNLRPELNNSLTLPLFLLVFSNVLSLRYIQSGNTFFCPPISSLL